MPTKNLSLEDLTATLQVPIPGIPGAYGEIELSGEGTATIALGAEVPVPILEDIVNAEVQLEINKEGEIAYGVEINLVGLNLELMVRGCDIVVDVGYGVLRTQAVFPIPDCENPGLPLPPELPPDPPPPDIPDPPVRTPPRLPDFPPDEPMAILVYCSYFQQINRRNDEIQKRTKRTSITTFNPAKQTEWIESEQEVINDGFQGGNYTLKSSFGWVNGISSWEAWSPAWGTFRWGYRGGIVIGSGDPATISEVVTAPPYQMYPNLFFFGKSQARGNGYVHWLYIGTLRELTTAFVEVPDVYDWWSSWGNSSYTLRRDIIAVPWSVDKTPPLQGEPPMKDCCNDLRAELRRLRKDIKKIKDDYVVPLYDVTAPDKFVETILPVELDDKGEPIKRDNKKKITLPAMLQAVGKAVSLEIPTNYFEIPDTWKPKSWSSKWTTKTASILELPDTKTVPFTFFVKAVSHFMYKISYILDPDDVRFSSVAASFVKPGAAPGESVDAHNYPEILALLFKSVDKYGFHPFAVKVDDTNLSEAGNQPKHTEYHSISTALQHVISEIEDMNAESNAHTEFLIRLAYEIGLCHTIGADSQQKLQNLQDFMGFEVVKAKKSMKMAFNPLAGSTAIQAAEKNNEEALEEQLPGLLENTSMPIVVDEFVGSKTLIDFMLELLNAARQKPKGNRWG